MYKVQDWEFSIQDLLFRVSDFGFTIVFLFIFWGWGGGRMPSATLSMAPQDSSLFLQNCGLSSAHGVLPSGCCARGCEKLGLKVSRAPSPKRYALMENEMESIGVRGSI